MPTRPRWTHLAFPVRDIDVSIAWYEEFTPLRMIARRHDDAGQSAWLSDPASAPSPFIAVLVAMDRAGDAPTATLAPFAHLGIELPERADVDEIAERGRAAGCLHWEPQDLPDPVGYVCALTDPDGNVVEFSHDQHVDRIAREFFDTGKVAGNGPRPIE